MKLKSLAYLFLVLLFSSRNYGQSKPSTDSLQQVLQTAKHDTIRLRILNAMIEAESDDKIWPAYNEQMKSLSEKLLSAQTNSAVTKTASRYLADAFKNIGYYYNNQGDLVKAIDNYNKSLKICEGIGDKKRIESALRNMASIYNNQGNNSKALEYFNKSLKIQAEIGDKKNMASNLLSMGSIFYNQGDIPKALEYISKSLKVQEEIGDKMGMADAYNNMAYISKNQGDVPRALEYYNKSLKLKEETGDKEGIATAFHNIGSTYYSQGDTLKALEYFDKSLKIKEEIGNEHGIAYSLNNLGMIYKNRGMLSIALEFSRKGLKIREKIGDAQGIPGSLNCIGSILLAQGQLAASKNYYEKAYQLSKEIRSPKNIEIAANGLKKVNEQLGNYKSAYFYYQEEMLMRDSIQNEKNYKASIQQRARYEYEKKFATDSIANVKEKEIKDMAITKQQLELKAKRNQQYALYGGLALLLLFAGFVLNRLKVTQKQKHIITQQKHLVEEKHKEITDSINYAERIQRSFLATKDMLDQHLKDYFVFFRPKDVVSGDFYWAGELNNGNFAFSVADSTGHGVPGAIMSILNISSIEKSIERETEPNSILNATRKIIIERLKKDGSKEGGKDGMDCSLLVLNQDRTQLWFAAANNPVFIVRENALIEYKPDKIPVGKHDRDSESFTLHTALLQKGDIIYALTDGFPDQFGGEKGKKYMIKNLKDFLLKISHLPLREQEQKLSNEFIAWKGENEQVDDVCIIGVRV
jgi:tetratricopeptide (TPR) repeat protein